VAHDILADPLFCVGLKNGDARLSLPALLAAAMADAIDDLPAVRPHQRQPLHAFLAQVGALALVTAGHRAAPDGEAGWAALLRGLTKDFPDDAPWTLLVEDVSKPALLQPPIPEGRLDALKERETTPDGLDMLVTSKNHDLKAARMRAATPEHWFLALLTVQTMEGFLGAGNYGIARMNGGFASRVMVGVAPPGGVGARLKRDILALVADHDANAREFAYPLRGGKALLWLEPWDGRTQLSPTRLDPYFIEVCRRIRLVEEEGRIVARRGGSEKARIAVDKSLGGKSGDPWAPCETTKVLTVDGRGFNYKRVAELLDPATFAAAPLQKVRREDGAGGVELHCLATARGQGGTDGFHQRRIPVRTGAARRLADDADIVGKLAQQQVEEAGTVRRGALNVALMVLFQNAPETVNFRHVASQTRAAPFLAAFDAAVDIIFFEALFALVEADSEAREAARKVWLSTLLRLAFDQLAAAETATPRAGLRRQLAIAAARDALAASFFNAFPSMREPADAGA
jgi:CRISPR system Cascade subunit CasA